MEGRDGTNWTPRMGRWTNAGERRSHRRRELQRISGVLRYIHHSDGCVTGNDILHYIANNYGDRSTWVHGGTLIRRILGVSEYVWVHGGRYIDEWNSCLQRSNRGNLIEHTEWHRNHTCVLGYGG